jgi:energy-coupling factor transporter ATP-binding protein EcfA2
MSVLDEILAWGAGLPPWQQDAIGRLFASGALTAQDDSDLLALLKAEHGIPDPEKRVAKTLDAAHILAPADTGQLTRLLSLSEVKNVNALAEKQTLAFDPSGLTIIYGDNGSGKSGYSRALKRACRARDQSEPILPDARLPPGPPVKATARFEMQVDGAPPCLVEWIDGDPPPEELAAIAIFDSHCARAYVDSEGDYSYRPYGLDILNGLALACHRMKARLEEEQANKQPSTAAFQHLSGAQTEVGKLLAGLNAKTSPAAVEALAKVSPEEMEERELIEKSLRQGNPKEKATQLSRSGARLQLLGSRCDQKLAVVSVEAAKELRALIDASSVAKQAAVIAARQFVEIPGLLPGTGGEAWKSLFEAARAFCVESHPDRAFPELGADSKCPLCQQPLGESAARLTAFEKFITAAAEKDWQQERSKAHAARKAIAEANFDLSIDAAFRDELRALDAELMVECDSFVKALKQRATVLNDACEPGADWDALPAAPESPSKKLKAHWESLRAEAKALEEAADAVARATLEERFKQLDARVRLREVKAAVLDAIERHGLQIGLQRCLGAVKTTGISNKAVELNEKVASQALEARLNAEFKRLNVESLHVRLKPFAVKGKTYYKLALELPGQQRPALILSEGEQRAVAIASFLAEIGIGGGKGGIVFDDPVSSMDHKRRELVAARLAEEASTRQVIVFTHDLYFLCLLDQEASRLKLPKATRALHRSSKGFGVCDDKLPMGGMSSRDRVGMLRNMQVECAKLHKSGDEREAGELIGRAYAQLRITWERSIEDVLFRGVIARFNEGVATQRLREVEVLDDDYATIDAAMSKCSKFAAHDGAAIANVATPTPDALNDDINQFEQWRKSIEGRAAATSKRRK